MIAITFALPAESSALISRLEDRQRKRSGDTESICGQIDSRRVTIFHTGVGRRITEKRLTEFLDQHSFKILISSGFAGGVSSDLNAGDLFMAENISDVELLTLAQVALTTRHPRRGKLLTSSGIVHSTAKRMELARERAADAIDMESDIVAQTCAERGVRMLSLRVISDTANAPLPAPPQVLFDVERQKTPFASLASHLLANPGAISRLIRFQRQIREARENLTEALAALLKDSSFANLA
jgi:nucleoside phosphorylase